MYEAQRFNAGSILLPRLFSGLPGAAGSAIDVPTIRERSLPLTVQFLHIRCNAGTGVVDKFVRKGMGNKQCMKGRNLGALLEKKQEKKNKRKQQQQRQKTGGCQTHITVQLLGV